MVFDIGVTELSNNKDICIVYCVMFMYTYNYKNIKNIVKEMIKTQKHITDRAGRRHPAPQLHGWILPPSCDPHPPRCGWRCCTAGCPSEERICYNFLL